MGFVSALCYFQVNHEDERENMKFLSVDQPWSDISEVLDQTRAKVFCAIGYIGKDAPSILRLGEGDVLVCDASDATVKSGSTYPEALLEYAIAGVNVYSISGLHAKVIVCGKTAWIGSMNASTSSKNLVEAAIRLDNKLMVKAALDFINEQKNLMPPLSKSEIRRLINLPRRKRPRGTGKSFQSSLEFPNESKSLKMLRTADDDKLSDLQKVEIKSMRKEIRSQSDDEVKGNSTLSYIRDRHKILSRRGDWILEIRGRSVKCPAVIVDIRGSGRNRFVWFYRPNENVQSISLKKVNESLKSKIPEADDARIPSAKAKEIWELFKA